MEKHLQPLGSKQKEIERSVPLLHVEQYYLSSSPTALTREEKKQFLEVYYATGNQTKAAKSCGRDRMGFMGAMDTDPVFNLDFHTVQQAIKNDLEEVMTTNGMTNKGYMDRITWLRKNFPQEYNPNADRNTEDKSQEVLKLLAAKLSDYSLIPKKDIINVEKENLDAR